MACPYNLSGASQRDAGRGESYPSATTQRQPEGCDSMSILRDWVPDVWCQQAVGMILVGGRVSPPVSHVRSLHVRPNRVTADH